MQLYAITNRHSLPGNDSERRAALIEHARNWASRGVDYIQIREKDLAERELRDLTQEIVSVVHPENRRTRILLNGPCQIAIESGADGVHLAASAPSHAAQEARSLFARSGHEAVISYSCHNREEVLKAKEESQESLDATTANTLILYAPVFEKILPNEPTDAKLAGQGLDSLKQAVEAAKPIPLFALGGVTPENARSCEAVGAAGVAGIRLFLQNHWQGLGNSKLRA